MNTQFSQKSSYGLTFTTFTNNKQDIRISSAKVHQELFSMLSTPHESSCVCLILCSTNLLTEKTLKQLVPSQRHLLMRLFLYGLYQTDFKQISSLVKKIHFLSSSSSFSSSFFLYIYIYICHFPNSFNQTVVKEEKLQSFPDGVSNIFKDSSVYS